jgi:hypothetical protein
MAFPTTKYLPATDSAHVTGLEQRLWSVEPIWFSPISKHLPNLIFAAHSNKDHQSHADCVLAILELQPF